MNPVYLCPIMMLLLIVVLMQQRNRETVYKQTVTRKKRQKQGDTTMIELAKKMIGKECLIYTFNGSQLQGTVREVEGGAMMLDNGKESEVVNLDFVVRIREFPKKKNGKNKSVVLD